MRVSFLAKALLLALSVLSTDAGAIFNGVRIAESEFPAVYKLGITINRFDYLKGTKDTRNSTCTGTAISSHALLTAAHCVYGLTKEHWWGGRPNLWVLKNQNESIQAKEVFVHAEYVYDDYMRPGFLGHSPQDLAVVIFDSQIFDTFYDLNLTGLKDQSVVMHVGYGDGNDTLGDEIGFKRKGENIYDSSLLKINESFTDGNRINVPFLKQGYRAVGYTHRSGEELGYGHRVSIGVGDSGGPLLLKSTNEIFGVASTTSSGQSESIKMKLSIYADLNYPLHRDFFFGLAYNNQIDLSGKCWRTDSNSYALEIGKYIEGKAVPVDQVDISNCLHQYMSSIAKKYPRAISPSKIPIRR